MGAIPFRRTDLLKATLLIVTGVLAACFVALAGAAGPVKAAFPGENGKIAFESNRDGSAYEIYAMNADGSGLTNLTNNPYVWDEDPDWGPLAATTSDAACDEFLCWGMTVSPDPVEEGESLTFTITASCSPESNACIGYAGQLTDTLPAGVEFVSAAVTGRDPDATCSQTEGTVTCGPIDFSKAWDGTEIPFVATIEVIPTQCGTFTNTATASYHLPPVSETFTVEGCEPAAPTLDLASASDSGSSTTDDKTNDDTPTFEGHAEAGATVKVYDGTTLLGSVLADGSTDPNNSANKAWSYTVGGAGAELGITALSEGTHTITANATDADSNTSEPPDASLTVLIDKSAPTLSFVGAVNDNDGFYYGDTPAAPTCSADDGLGGSGVDGACTVSGYGTAVGTHTLATNAVKDVAGNEAQALSLTYRVLPWTINGFYSPVDMPGELNTVNVAKAGSTVPLKFEVFKGTTELTNIGAVKAFTQKITCPTLGSTDDIEKYASGKTVLRYDATAGQFVFNWQTPKSPGSCYEVTMSAKDDYSKITAYFRLK